MDETGRNPLPGWQWDEIRQVGTDYTDMAEIARYDRRMGEFRDSRRKTPGSSGSSPCPAGRASWRLAPARGISRGPRRRRATG